MFLKKIMLLVLTSITLAHATSVEENQPLLDTNETLRGGPENKSFSNARVYNTLQTKDLYVEGNTIIGANLKVNKNTVINGNLTVDGTISSSGSVSGPGSSTPNSVAIFADGSGTAITDSPVLIDGTGNMSGVNDLAMTGDLTGVTNITMAGGDLTGVNNVTMTGGDLTGVNNIAMTGDLTGVQNITMAGDLTGVQDISMSGTLTGVQDAYITNNLTVGNNITASGVIAAQDLSSSGTLFVSAIANINSPSAVVTWPTTVGAAGTFLGIDMSGNLVYSTPAGAGDVSAAANFTTNNRIVLTDTPNGAKNVKESANVIIDGSDNITGIAALGATTINATTVNATTVNAPTLNGNATTATNTANVGTKTAAQVETSVNDTQAATNAGTAGAIVRRDGVGLGGFTAGTITATQFNGPLNGNANTATSATTAGSATNFTGNLQGDVIGTQGTTIVSLVGGKTAAQVATSVNDTIAATDLNTPSTIVKRNGSGNFSAGTITATQFNGGQFTGTFNGNATTATSAVMSDTAQWFTVNLAGNVTGPQLATVVAAVGNKSTAQVVQSVDDTLAATSNSTDGTIVKRDGSSHFSIDSITINNAPTADSDATNKAYVDSIAGGLEPKAPVLATSIVQTPTATLATPVDGVTLSANDRVLLTQQSYQVDNGIWLAQSTDWTRPLDFSIGSTAGQAFVLTTSGLSLAGSGWICSTPLAVVGTDTVTFVQYSSSGNTTAANVGTGVGQVFRDKTGLTLNFKTLAGATVIPAATGNFVTVTNGANEVSFAVTATSDNTANTLVARDATGTFAGTLTGHASLDVLKTGDTMTGNLIMAPSAGPTRSQINWQDNGGINYVGLRAPAAVGASYTVALPDIAPTAGQFLQALSDSVLTWTAVHASPALTKTYYVDLSGSDSNDGSLAMPFRTIKYAVSVAKVGANPFTNPRVVQIGAGRFTEEKIDIDVSGLSIVGAIEHSTIIRPANPTTENLFEITAPWVELSNFTLQVTPGTSLHSAINMSISAYGRSRFNQLGFAFFNTGISFNTTTTSAIPIFLEELQFGHNGTDISAVNSHIILSSSYFNGPNQPSINPPGNTGILLDGSYCKAYIFGDYFSYLQNALSVTNGANASISSSSIEKTNNGVVCASGSKALLTGVKFSLNNATSVNVTATGVGTRVVIEGCLFDCDDASGNPSGTAIQAEDGAELSANSCIIEEAEVGIKCLGNSTSLFASSVTITETVTCIQQRDTSLMHFVGGSFDSSTLDIENATNVSFAAFDTLGDETHLSIGNAKDTNPFKVYEILNGQASEPHLSYEPDYYGHKGTVYANANNNPTFNATQSDLNDARYFVVTGKNYKEAGISLISDSNNIGNYANVRGWSITKTGTFAELVFTFTNNDPGVGTPNCGPYDIMQLNGFDNQVEFPIATGTLPTNLTAKLVWGGEPNTNLYRSAVNTLKTDANFIVGGALTAGSTFITTLTLAAGTPAQPSLQFAGSTNTGLSAQTANRLSFDTLGVERMSIDSTGTVSINQFTIAGVVHNNASGQLSSSLIVNADVSPSAAISDTKLAVISTAGKVLDSATTATSNNIFNTIVKRDTSGNFLANVITATLNGNATSATSALSAITSTTSTYFTGLLFGDVTGLQSTTSVARVGGKTATAVAAATTDVELSTTINTPNTLVRRNATGGFAAGMITATLFGNATTATSAITSTTSTYFTGLLFGDVTGLQSTTSVARVGGQTATAVAAAVIDVQLSTTVNTPNTLVRRGTTGDFAAGMITASLTGMVTGTASFNVLKIGDTMTGSLTLPPGTAAAPSLNFTGGTTTGLSMPSADYLSFDTAGVERMSILPTGTIVANAGFVFANTMALGAIQTTTMTATGQTSNVNSNTSLLILFTTLAGPISHSINFPAPTMQGQLFTITFGGFVPISNNILTLANTPVSPATGIVNTITNFSNTNTYQATRARCSATYIYFGTTWYLCGRG
jgi:hypothetical protein